MVVTVTTRKLKNTHFTVLCAKTAQGQNDPALPCAVLESFLPGSGRSQVDQVLRSPGLRFPAPRSIVTLTEERPGLTEGARGSIPWAGGQKSLHN